MVEAKRSVERNQESFLTRRLVEGWEDEVVESEKTGDGDAKDNV